MASRAKPLGTPQRQVDQDRIDKIESGEEPLDFLMRPGVSCGGRAGVEPLHVGGGGRRCLMSGMRDHRVTAGARSFVSRLTMPGRGERMQNRLGHCSRSIALMALALLVGVAASMQRRSITIR
jgi:hypothetical protein